MIGALALGAVVAVLIFASGRGPLTRADLPVLRSLSLTKREVLRRVHLCEASKIDNRLLGTTQALGAVVGFGAGVATGSFRTALEFARKTTSTLQSLGVDAPPDCAPIDGLLADNARLSKQLGLDPGLGEEEIWALIGQLGGIDYSAEKAAVRARGEAFYGAEHWQAMKDAQDDELRAAAGR